MKYNIYHPVWYGEKNPHFSLRNEYPIIGYSDEAVVFFIIKPQFSLINFNNIMIDLIFDVFTILNVTQTSKTEKYIDNFDRYHGKTILACIITLDTYKPIFYNLNIDKNDIQIKDIVNKYLYDEYSRHHELIYNFYKYHKTNKPDKKRNVFQYIVDTFTKNHECYNNLPEYIIEFFKYNKGKLQDCENKIEKNKILTDMDNKDTFTTKLDEKLKMEIEQFLNIETDDEDGDY
jgi:hypothetical protein